MDGIKLEELEKAFKKEKDHKVRVRMAAVHVVHMLDMSVEETARIQALCPTWVRNRLRRYDEEGLRNLIRY